MEKVSEQLYTVLSQYKREHSKAEASTVCVDWWCPEQSAKEFGLSFQKPSALLGTIILKDWVLENWKRYRLGF